MLTAQISPQRILVANLHKEFLGRKKELSLSSPEDFKGERAVVVLPAAVTKIYQETITAREQLPELIGRYLVELKIEESQALYFATKLDTPANAGRYLLVHIDKARFTKLLRIAQQKKLKIEGFLPEPIVLHKLLADEIAGDEKRLILHIGEEDSSIYLLDKFGPVRVLSQVVATAKLIPEIQKFLQEFPEIEKVCRLGVYFGEESLAFDEKVFEEQTGIELIPGDKALSTRLQKAGITLTDGEALNKFVALAAAAMLFNKKEIIKLDEIGLDSGGSKSMLAKPKVQPLVVKERRLPNMRPILCFLGGALIVAGLVLGALRLRSRGFFAGQTAIPTTVPAQSQPSPKPTLSPVPTVNPKDVKIRVLNGSGVKGGAGKIASYLENQDFEVVNTANASSFDFEKTEVRYKEDAKAKADLVIKSLVEEISVATAQASLSEDDVVDVEIIIGKE